MNFGLKQILLYAIAPAVIAGLFSVAPKIYEVAVEPKADLRYVITSGPQITTDGSIQQVISVKVKNAGKKPLTSISAELITPNAMLLAYSINNSTGLRIEHRKQDDRIIVQLSKALEGESFSVSALVKSTASPIDPQFRLRSDEVLGHPEENVNPRKELNTTLFGALGAALSVLAMSLAALQMIKRVVLPRKRSSILYIASAMQDEAFIESVRREGDEIRYLQFADMLLTYGRSSEKARDKAAIALTCLHAIESMSDRSRELTRRNLGCLASSLPGPGKGLPISDAKVDASDAIAFRDFVDKVFFAGPGGGAASSNMAVHTDAAR